MTVKLRGVGPRIWAGKRDKEGHRTFTVQHQVETDTRYDGPHTVMFTPGLPAIGSLWNFGNDNDSWAFCYPLMDVNLRDRKENVRLWDVDQTFSTKPLTRCQDESIEDPLLEPPKIGGGFANYTKEATTDINGVPILSSSWETVRGKAVEVDADRSTVWVEQNVATLGQATFATMINTVNDDVLWGFAARKVKLSMVTWERKLYGVCDFYYTRRFEFQTDDNTFDLDDILDEGTKAYGYWDGDDWIIAGNPADPSAARKYLDKNDNPARVLLDGFGQPNIVGAVQAKIPRSPIKYYTESDFLALGIPTEL